MLEEYNLLSEKIIGCAIEVHKNLGPGLLESIYEKALCYEFKFNGLQFVNQHTIPIFYKKVKLGEHRIDMMIENKIIVEIKAVERIDPVFTAQLLSYLRLTDIKLGLLINFNVPLLKDGISRIIL